MPAILHGQSRPASLYPRKCQAGKIRDKMHYFGSWGDGARRELELLLSLH